MTTGLVKRAYIYDDVGKGRKNSYRDTGCKAATDYLGHQSECLECPFEKCAEEKSKHPGPLSFKERQKSDLMTTLRCNGFSVKEIANRLGICKETVYRHLRR